MPEDPVTEALYLPLSRFAVEPLREDGDAELETL